MKREFTKFMAAIALLVFMAPTMVGWGQSRETRDYTALYSADFRTVANHSYTQNKTFTLNGKSWTASVSQVASNVFYLGCNSNNAAKGILNNNSTFSAEVAALRAADATYNTNYTTAHAYALQFDNAYSDVTKITFNWDGGNNAFQVYLFGDSGSGYVLLGHTNYASSGAAVAGSVEWTGTATNFTKFAIVARPGAANSTATSKTLRAATFYIYKTTGSSLTQSDLTITNQSTALTFDLYNNATAQVINYTTSSTGAITINPGSPTNYFSYVHDANAKTITVTPLAVTPSAQTVTISQEADATYDAGSAFFTVSVANSAPLANIAALTANTTSGSYNVTLTNAVVTYVNGSNAYIQDASGAVLYQKSGHGLTAGDVLNGTATVSYQLYNGNPQITDLTGVTPVSGTAPNPTTVAQSAWNYTFNNVLSQYFQITGATITYNNSKYYVSLGGENIQLYRSGTALSGLDLTKTYTITGFPMLYNSTKELQVYEVPQVEISTDPTVIVTPATLASFTYEEGNGPSTTKTLSVEGANLTNAITISLTNGQNSAFEMSLTENSGYTNTLTLNPTNNGTVAATTVYVRMKAGLSVNANAYEDDITIASTGATSVTVNLTGTVTVPVGPHVTWDLSTNTFASATDDLVTWSSNFATMTNAKGNSSTNANNYLGGNSNYTHTRFYQNQVLTITPATGYAITSVEINAVTSYVAGFTGNQWTNASASTSGTTVTVTPTDGSQAISVVISAACRATAVTVYYTQHVVQSYDLTVSALTNVEMFVFDYDDQTEALIEGGATAQTESVLEGTHVLVSVSAASGYALATFMVDGVDHLADIEDDAYDFIMPSHDVTITATAVPVYTVMFSVDGQEWAAAQMEVSQGQAIGTLPTPVAASIPAGYVFVGWYTDNYTNATTAPNYVTSAFVPTSDITLKAVFAEDSGTAPSLTKMTSSDSFAEGDNVVIVAVGENNSYSYAMYQQTQSNSYVGKYVFDGNVATVAADDKNWLTVSAGTGTNVWILGDATNGYVYNSSNNDLNVDTEHSTEFTLAWNNEQGKFTLVGNNRRLSYREDLSNAYFRMGGSSSTNPSGNAYFDIYKYVAGNASYSNYTTSSRVSYSEFTLPIVGYGADYDPDNNNNAGYYLIASPVSEAITPNQNNGFITGNYDLYYFDYAASDGLEWRNYKANPFTIENGKGYLYASYGDTELVFSGTGFVGEYDEDLICDVANITLSQGWNIIGNPFSPEQYEYGELFTEGGQGFKDFYRMNEDRNDFVIVEDGDDVVNPMEGVLVWGEEDGEVVSFLSEAITPNAKKSLSINISKNRGNVIDRAMVRFNGGGMLPKLQLNPSHTKIYITEGNQDYAVVRSANEGELPVSFRASENGTYTLSVEVNNLEMNYLHLIDNMTGADVDLLATPSYTFEAKTTDYASRFRLVFSAEENGASTGSATFAFFNGSEWIISNTGDATLQVVDVMGRVLSSETVNGNATISLNQVPGVYMLRLVNGDNVQVQKIVVR